MLKPLVVSWGCEAEQPGPSQFVDHHEWWGTRDLSAFLSVPAAIQFQKNHDWDNVRAACRELALDAQQSICRLTGLSPLHSDDEGWFRQMSVAPLPADTDLAALKERLYNEFRIEVPLIAWNGHKLIRVSVQGYNTRRDVSALTRALQVCLGK
jgi:isopenicillin-N epimerase